MLHTSFACHISQLYVVFVMTDVLMTDVRASRHVTTWLLLVRCVGLYAPPSSFMPALDAVVSPGLGSAVVGSGARERSIMIYVNVM